MSYINIITILNNNIIIKKIKEPDVVSSFNLNTYKLKSSKLKLRSTKNAKIFKLQTQVFMLYLQIMKLVT